MKWSLLLLLLNISGLTYGQRNFEATAYYKTIKEEQAKIGQEIYVYKTSVSDLNLRILNFQIKKSIAILDSTPAYNQEEYYKKATVNLFSYFLSVSENQYKQLLNYVEDPSLDNKEYKSKIQALFKDISIKEKPFDIAYNAAEENFIRKYGVKPE